jgi:ABC-type antimicrobial peptide transport system permease subunit
MIPATQRATTQLIEDRVDQAMRPWRVAALLFAALGLVALALSCVGVYSVMSYMTSERIPELGIRLVLGATGGGLVALVLRSGLRLVGAGIILGLGSAALGARLLSALLFGVSPFDPVVYVAAAAMLTVIGIAAILVPALRVLRTDPTVALRAE